VITASTTMGFDGQFVARKGDEVSCPLHPDVKPNLILEGDDSMMEEARPLRATPIRRRAAATCTRTLFAQTAFFLNLCCIDALTAGFSECGVLFIIVSPPRCERIIVGQ
jgi:hypothetical protein